MSHRYCDADEAAQLNAPAATPETAPLTLTPWAVHEIRGALLEALTVLGRLGTTKDFRLAQAIRAARVRLTTASAYMAARSSAPSGRLPERESEGASKDSPHHTPDGDHLPSHSGGGGAGKPGREGAR